MPSFHEVRFPLDISMHGRGGPERRTDIVVTGSGREQRNARWSDSRRRYDAGYGVKSLAAIGAVVAFFEERRGKLYGFRWRDRADYKSCAADCNPAPTDQFLGVGNGVNTRFPLRKSYGMHFAPYTRDIVKPVNGSLRMAVNGVEHLAGRDFDLDETTGIVTFRAGHVPTPGASVTAGFLFDVPVRFDTDYLEIDLAAFDAGDIPKIPLIEIRP
ncbi:MAG: hypothetical protein JWM36_3735 [Hyphomicrobiales bacterium]|nr:hypothetical protein [Hyphomicrobiales bacterium]